MRTAVLLAIALIAIESDTLAQTGQTTQPGAATEWQQAAEEHEQRIAAGEERIIATLQTFAREALAEKATVADRDERRRLAEAIVAETPKNAMGLTDLPKLRDVFGAIAIRPPYMVSFRYLVLYHGGPFQMSAKEEVAAMLERMYRAHSHSGGGSAPAVEWREGHAEILLNMGRYAEAREQIRSAMDEYGDSARTYTRVLSAIIERMNGDPEPFHRLVSGCRVSDADGMGERYCWVVTRTIASRAVELALTQDLDPFIELLVEFGRSVPTDYGTRLSNLRTLSHTAPKIAERELMLIVADRNAPSGARSDAAVVLADQGKRNDDSRRSAAWRDCSLHFRGAVVPPFPEDGWSQLVAQSRKPPQRSAPCADDEEEAHCVLATLSNRVFDGTGAKDWPLARQGAEQIAAWTLKHQLDVFHIAQIMATIGERQIDAGRKAEGVRAIEFALLLNAHVGSDVEAVEQLTIKPAHESATPWDGSPTRLEPLPQLCQKE